MCNLGSRTLQSISSTTYERKVSCACRCRRGSSNTVRHHFVLSIHATAPEDSLSKVCSELKYAQHVCEQCNVEHLLKIDTRIVEPSTVPVLHVSRRVNPKTGVVDRQNVHLPRDFTIGHRHLHLVSTASHFGSSRGGHYSANIYFSGIWWLLDDSTTLQIEKGAFDLECDFSVQLEMPPVDTPITPDLLLEET